MKTRKELEGNSNIILVAIVLAAMIMIANAMPKKAEAAQVVFDKNLETNVLEVEDIPEATQFYVDYNCNTVDLDAWNPEDEPLYTEEDLEYLTMLLAGECQDESFENQKKYGSVALNRANESNTDYPNTIKGVCLDKKYGIQYASFYDGNAYREPTERNKEVAKWLLTNGSVYPINVIYQSEFKQGSEVYEIVGNTYFCCR